MSYSIASPPSLGLTGSRKNMVIRFWSSRSSWSNGLPSAFESLPPNTQHPQPPNNKYPIHNKSLNIGAISTIRGLGVFSIRGKGLTAWPVFNRLIRVCQHGQPFLKLYRGGCMYIYVYTYIYTYPYIYRDVYTPAYACKYIHTCVYIHISVCIYIYIYISTRICLCAHLHARRVVKTTSPRAC